MIHMYTGIFILHHTMILSFGIVVTLEYVSYNPCYRISLTESLLDHARMVYTCTKYKANYSSKLNTSLQTSVVLVTFFNSSIV